MKIDWNKFVDEDEDEVGGERVGFGIAELVRYFTEKSAIVRYLHPTGV